MAPTHNGFHRNLHVVGRRAFTLAAAAVTYALTRASENGWTSSVTLGGFALALVSTVVFLFTEHRLRPPMIELSLLARGRFSGVLIAAMMLSISASAH